MIKEIYVTKGCFLPSKKEDVIDALKAYCKNKTFCDLGSGDGQVVAWAKQCGAKKPRGIEFEPMATDIRDDFFHQDIHQYEVLFYYMGGATQEEDLLRWIKNKFTGIFLLNEGVVEGVVNRDLILERTPVIKLGKTKVYRLGD